jgi:hypothetical protein
MTKELSMKTPIENKHKAPPPCVNSDTFSCTVDKCDYCHDDGEDGGGLYCEKRDTHFVF